MIKILSKAISKIGGEKYRMIWIKLTGIFRQMSDPIPKIATITNVEIDLNAIGHELAKC